MPQPYRINVKSATFSAQANDDAQPTGRHLVVFNSSNKVPAGFAQRVAGLGGAVVTQYGKIGVAVVAGLSDDAAAQLQAFSDTKIVEQDVEVQYVDPAADVELIAVDAAAPASAANPQTASFFARQWHLRAIGADQAWAAGILGSSDVTVAILDTGIDPTHPDLQGRVDFARSKSFVPSDGALVNANFPGAPMWADLHYHGTHVAATVSSNAVAAAGVTSGVKLMAVKVLSAKGSGASRVTAACSKTSLTYRVCATGTYVLQISGTSMASPHAAGVAALIVEQVGKRQPSQVVNRLMQTADDLGDEGRDGIYGRGRINVVKALGL